MKIIIGGCGHSTHTHFPTPHLSAGRRKGKADDGYTQAEAEASPHPPRRTPQTSKRARKTPAPPPRPTISDETGIAAVTALEKLLHPDKRAAAFATQTPKAQAAFVRKHVAPITTVLKSCTGIEGLEGWDLNTLEGIATGVGAWKRRTEQSAKRQRGEFVDEFRSLEEKRLQTHAALTHFGRGASLSAMTDIRHTECLETIGRALSRAPLRRSRRCVQQKYKVWFTGEEVLRGFAEAVELEPGDYLELPRATPEDCEEAAEIDANKIRYYATCILQVEGVN